MVDCTRRQSYDDAGSRFEGGKQTVNTESRSPDGNAPADIKMSRPTGKTSSGTVGDGGGGGDPLSPENIFREMIEREVRNGRLTAHRRKRIIRYAAQLRLNAVDAGIMVRECQERMALERKGREQPFQINEGTPRLTYHDVSPHERSNVDYWLIWLIVGLAIAADAAFFSWLI